MSPLRLAVLLGAAAGACLVLPAGLEAHDLPAAARPGECYGKTVSPAVYGTERRQELVRKGWTETRRTAAVVERVAKKVLVSPAVVERYRTPPTYRTVVEWVVHPGPVRRVYEPARYDVVRDRVQVEAGHAEWRRTDAPLAYGETNSGQTLVQGTGEIMCRVWVPARYDTVERRVMVSRGRSYEIAGPSRREKIVRRELVSAGGWYEKRKPAIYRTDYVDRVVRPARTEVIAHPALYRTVLTRSLVRPARAGWSRLPCEHSVVAVAPPPPPPVYPRNTCHCTLSETPQSAAPAPAPAATPYYGAASGEGFMARVQRALIAQGFDPGIPDGQGKAKTFEALRQFQRQHHLAEGQITPETVQALGVG